MPNSSININLSLYLFLNSLNFDICSGVCVSNATENFIDESDLTAS
ncbi:hypothetical protein [Clostridium tetani]|nr:hypothetical protein [Clostridium tetani]WFN62936.1 hypothetical protein PAA20_05665 [Clostridium tetani]